MDILMVILLLGVRGVDFVMSATKIYMEKEQSVKEYKKPAHWSYSKKEFYFANIFNLTDELQYERWDDFLLDFKYFKSHPFRVAFRRDDEVGGIANRTKLLSEYDLNLATRYDYDLENVYKEPAGYSAVRFASRTTSPEHFLSWTLDRNFIHLNRKDVFFENIVVGASYHKCLIKVALQQYVKDCSLMLRAVYYVKLYSLWSAVASTVNINTGDYVGFYGMFKC